MVWVKLDDHFDEHPKIMAAGGLGIALWAMGLAYCNRQKIRDGFLPLAKVLSYAPLVPRPRLIAARLVAVGLWDAADDGYRVHDYHDFQLTPEQMAERRAVRAEAGRRGGLRSGIARSEAREEAKLKQVASRGASTSEATVEANVEAKTNPVPVPVPSSPEPGPESDPQPGKKESPSGSLRSPSPPRGSARRRRLPFPEDEVCTAEISEEFRAGGCGDPAKGYAHYRDHHRAKGTLNVDWNAARRNWIARHGMFGCPCQQGDHHHAAGRNGTSPLRTANSEDAAKWEREKQRDADREQRRRETRRAVP